MRREDRNVNRTVHPQKALGKDPSLPLPASSGPKWPLSCSRISSSSASVLTWPSLSLKVSVSFLLTQEHLSLDLGHTQIISSRSRVISPETFYRFDRMAQMLKNPPAMQETLVPSLGQEDSLEKGRATHSNILAWKITWTEEPGRL